MPPVPSTRIGLRVGDVLFLCNGRRSVVRRYLANPSRHPQKQTQTMMGAKRKTPRMGYSVCGVVDADNERIVAVVYSARQTLRRPTASESESVPTIPVVAVVCREERKRKKRSVPAQLRWCSPTSHSSESAFPGKREGVGIGRRAGRRKYILRVRRRDVLVVVVWRTSIPRR
ncbi:hypothetical protein C8F01DRAFT_1143570 [Mycena amicta]|nr:hypothetical protein C8F01DRAFT_1143570 [Mycena amicta]